MNQTGRVTRKLKVHDVHRRKLLDPIDQNCLPLWNLADLLQNGGEIFAAIAEYVLTRERRFAHLVRDQIKKMYAAEYIAYPTYPFPMLRVLIGGHGDQI